MCLPQSSDVIPIPELTLSGIERRISALGWETSELKTLYFSLIEHNVVYFEEVKFSKFDVFFYVLCAYPYIFYRITISKNNFDDSRRQ